MSKEKCLALDYNRCKSEKKPWYHQSFCHFLNATKTLKQLDRLCYQLKLEIGLKQQFYVQLNNVQKQFRTL